jgi:NAD+-dependent secondary alcohol dehydrogenase Adh1
VNCLQHRAIGNLVGTYNDLVELMTLAAQGKITLHTTIYPLEAIQALETGNIRGRAVLVP